MGTVIAFPAGRRTAGFSADDRAALDRLVDRLRHAGAVRWDFEREPDRMLAFVLGAEDETLLIVAKGPMGITVQSGFAHELLWRGPRLAGYA